MAETEIQQDETQAPVEATQGAAESTATDAQDARNRRKTRVGTVLSDRSEKTVTVVVERRLSHPLYGKGVKRTKKYHAHDEKNEYKTGDVVRIMETRPLSKTKRWRVIELIERPA